MSKDEDPRLRMRAGGEYLESVRNEKRRQDLGRHLFAAVMGEPQLAELVSCSICGLLDDTDPCGDHPSAT